MSSDSSTVRPTVLPLFTVLSTVLPPQPCSTRPTCLLQQEKTWAHLRRRHLLIRISGVAPASLPLYCESALAVAQYPAALSHPLTCWHVSCGTLLPCIALVILLSMAEIVFPNHIFSRPGPVFVWHFMKLLWATVGISITIANVLIHFGPGALTLITTAGFFAEL